MVVGLHLDVAAIQICRSAVMPHSLLHLPVIETCRNHHVEDKQVLLSFA